MTKSIEQDIISEFGKGILSSGQSIVDSQQKVIPVSPGLDLTLGGGIPEGSFVILTGPPKVGKAQSLDSIIYTIDGPKLMGDIKISDTLCHPNGGHTKVTEIFPQGLIEAYKVTFSDGSHVICCEDHLWKVKTRFTDWKILSTKEIKQAGLRLSNEYKWMIPSVQSVSFRYYKLTIDPYQRRIIDIKKLPNKIPMQCITVSSDDGLYLTDNFIVTHNTSLALDFAGTAQQIQYACELGRKEGRHVYYSAVEGRLKRRDLMGVHHLITDEDRLSIIQSQPGTILTAENFIDINERLINQKPGDIFIIDSFSALCSAGELKSNIGDRYRADVPVLLAKFCRRISNVIPINKSIVIGITHIIANQGGGMSKWSEASGRKIQYQTDVKLKATHFTPWIVKDNQIGQEVHWCCETSALNTPPGRKFSSKFRYGYGIDKEAEIVDLAVDLGIIKKGGAWYTLPDDVKLQGKESVVNHLKTKQGIELYESLNQQIRNLMGLCE